jgi:hypothetical protein
MVHTMPSTAAARSDPALPGLTTSSPGGPTAGPRLSVDLVDVRRATVQPVRIWLEGPMLQMAGRGLLRQVPMAHIDWHQSMPPQTPRTARLPDGSALCAANPQEWDAWCRLSLQAVRPALSPAHGPRLWGSVALGLALVMLVVWAAP